MPAAHKEKVKRLLFILGKVYRFACFLQQPNQLNWTSLTLMVKFWLLMCSNLQIYSGAEYPERYCVKGYSEKYCVMCHTLAPF